MTIESSKRVELVCPAGSLPALKAAVDCGADAVYMGFRDATNARNFPGLNFDEGSAAKGIEYAHQRGVKVLLGGESFVSAAQPRPAAIGTCPACRAKMRRILRLPGPGASPRSS